VTGRRTVARRLLGRLRSLLGTQPDKHDDSQLLDASDDDRRIVDAVAPYTMSSRQRRYALVQAVDHVLRRRVPGAFVECGVWRGGSALAMLLALQRAGASDRELWMYDTFEGMTMPSGRDVSRFDPPARQTWDAAQAAGRQAWDYLFQPDQTGEQAVEKLLLDAGCPRDRLHLVRGKVQDTLPAQMPGEIALLRLDTDWYDSTRHELEHLYPRLSRGGVLIVDDYGHWQGCREAVDEYFARPDVEPVLLHRVDYTGRVAIKP
jgi:O-methyltransferase